MTPRLVVDGLFRSGQLTNCANSASPSSVTCVLSSSCGAGSGGKRLSRCGPPHATNIPIKTTKKPIAPHRIIVCCTRIVSCSFVFVDLALWFSIANSTQQNILGTLPLSGNSLSPGCLFPCVWLTQSASQGNKMLLVHVSKNVVVCERKIGLSLLHRRM
jgi:hypothetical protein